MKYAVFFLLALLIISCSDDHLEKGTSDNNFNIYLVDQNEESLSSDEIDIEALKLERKAWVKSEDILFYDWSAQVFYLNKEVSKKDNSGKRFVVANGNNRIFHGIFWPMHLSSFPSAPSIMPEDDWWSPKDLVRFNVFGFMHSDELYENEAFKAELIDAGLFKEGINVEITELKRKSATTLAYTFQIRNLEDQNIYVLDPDKMGIERFHYHTNGPGIQQGDHYFWPDNFDSESTDEIEESWYKKLGPGESMTRTIDFDAYSMIPLGRVKVTFRFPGSNLLQTGAWKKPDGRIWIGGYTSQKEISIN